MQGFRGGLSSGLVGTVGEIGESSPGNVGAGVCGVGGGVGRDAGVLAIAA